MAASDSDQGQERKPSHEKPAIPGTAGQDPIGSQSAQGGTTQDGMGQSGHNNSPDQTKHNLDGGGVTGP